MKNENRKNQISEQNRDPFRRNFYLTDGGFETTLVFKEGITLNHFAAFELITSDTGRDLLKHYFTPYLDLAVKFGLPFIADTPTWRANPDWAYKLGYSNAELDAINKNSVKLIRSITEEHDIAPVDILISGTLGPRGDGYLPGQTMTVTEAESYHFNQIMSLAVADADFVTAFTINYSEEAIGIVRAAKTLRIPVIISFTLETDGNLPSGESLGSAITKVDEVTDGYAAHFMINCAHPKHFTKTLQKAGNWKNRLQAIRANASAKSHAELDQSLTLDSGDKCMLANEYLEIERILPNLKVAGGCCGTDHNHIAKICEVLSNKEPLNCNE
ncbi:MAG: homocysteine S-methyltransferase family protein [Balneolaceae bacterium]|jgi:S-methylmethionine-dependent homocysteine/selenocysteine methylase